MNLIASLEAEIKALLAHFGIMSHKDAVAVLNKVATDVKTAGAAAGAGLAGTVNVAKALAASPPSSLPDAVAKIVAAPGNEELNYELTGDAERVVSTTTKTLESSVAQIADDAKGTADEAVNKAIDGEAAKVDSVIENDANQVTTELNTTGAAEQK